MGIEPNEHQIPRFQGKYDYHTDHSENPERPNSPNVLPMSQWCWGVGFFVSMNLSVSQGNLGEQWDWCEDHLNFPESGWWGRILSAMKVPFPIIMGFLGVKCMA